MLRAFDLSGFVARNLPGFNLTNYLAFMGEPAKLVRYKLGYIVLGFLSILFVLVYALKKEIWKDIL